MSGASADRGRRGRSALPVTGTLRRRRPIADLTALLSDKSIRLLFWRKKTRTVLG